MDDVKSFLCFADMVNHSIYSMVLNKFIVKRDETSITIGEGYCRLMRMVDELNNSFYREHLHADPNFKNEISALYSSYQILMASCKLIAEIDAASLSVMLEDNLSILHPHFLSQLAETNFAEFLEKINMLAQIAPSETPIKKMLDSLVSLKSRTVTELKIMNKVLTEWQSHIQWWQRTSSAPTSQSQSLPPIFNARWQFQNDATRNELSNQIEKRLHDAVVSLQQSCVSLSKSSSSLVNNFSKINSSDDHIDQNSNNNRAAMTNN